MSPSFRMAFIKPVKIIEILTFKFDFILVSFFYFWVLRDWFGCYNRVRQMFWGLLMQLKNFHFHCFYQFRRLILTQFWGHFLLFGALTGYFLGLGKGPKTVLGSTHVVKQLSFSLFLSILTFDFNLILGSFFTFWGPNGLFLGLGQGSKTVLGSPNID